jgi:hypothetical protein
VALAGAQRGQRPALRPLKACEGDGDGAAGSAARRRAVAMQQLFDALVADIERALPR